MSATASLRIAELRAEIENLKVSAAQELRSRRDALAAEIDSIDRELAAIYGKSEASKPARRRNSPVPRSIALQDLKEMLNDAPEKTLNLRKAGLEVRNVRVLADANPGLLKLGGKKPWPTVTLLK